MFISYTFFYSVIHKPNLSKIKMSQMTVYNLYIFDRNCSCLFYKQWSRNKEAGISKDEEFKLMYGMIFSIKSLISRLSTTSAKEGFVSYATSTYKLHFFETPTGLKFVLNTDTDVGDVQEILWHIYSKLYVEYVVKNPLCKPGEWISSELFGSKLDSYVQNLTGR